MKQGKNLRVAGQTEMADKMQVAFEFLKNAKDDDIEGIEAAF